MQTKKKANNKEGKKSDQISVLLFLGITLTNLISMACTQPYASGQNIYLKCSHIKKLIFMNNSLLYIYMSYNFLIVVLF